MMILPSLAAAMSIDLSAESTRSAPNDQFEAVAFSEAGGASPSAVARMVNQQLAAALVTARRYPGVRVRSGATQTFPVYGKDGRIDGWRMRSELLLQSQDATVLSELIAAWQTTLGIARLQAQPSAQTRMSVENAATLDAIAAFRAKAQAIADVFGKPYRIKQLTVGGNDRPRAPVMMRALAASAGPSPAPLEAGESEIGVTVTGQILIDEPPSGH
ncbi:SIMPL domain-containing protein [Paludibacterium yongneupense]|nr:SIMPL domain-containing protein [Paludibacterium yongneupense]